MTRNPDSKRNSPTVLVLIVLLAVVTPMLAWVTGLLKPKDLPEVLQGYVEGDLWAAFLFLVVLSILLAIAYYLLTRAGTKSEPSYDFTRELRLDLLTLLKVRYRKRLDDSLQHQVRLQLDLRETPEAVTIPGLSRLHEGGDVPIARGTPAQRVFDDAGGRLLIMGQPGAGKSTILLDLAAVLVERAISDQKELEPVPVVVNLASWSRYGGSIREWLVGALESAAGVNDAALARTLVLGNRLLVLFDGLDEVAAEKRTACVEAINDYLGERAERVVVCCRTDEYEASGTKLNLLQAVRIEPLDPDKVLQSLKGPQTQGIREALRGDALLRQLMTTPLMLSVILLTYIGERVPHSGGEPERLQQRLWDGYVVRMFRRRNRGEQRLLYPPRKALTWLAWLGRHMKQDGMTDFIVDHLQPTWLARPRKYRVVVCLVFGLVGGLVVGLAGGLFVGLVAGLAAGLVFGLAAGLVFGMLANSIEPQERIVWSWYAMVSSWRVELVFGLAVGLVSGLAAGLVSGLVGGLAAGLVFGLVGGLVVGLVMLCYSLAMNGLVATYLDTDAIRPGERLRSSLWNGLATALAFGLAVGLATGLVFGLVNEMFVGLWMGLQMGLAIFSIELVARGVGEVLKHYVLRAHLVQESAAPWRYIDYLLFASDLLLLQQDNDVIRFRHILLRDYFAALTPERIEVLAERVAS